MENREEANIESKIQIVPDMIPKNSNHTDFL